MSQTTVPLKQQREAFIDRMAGLTSEGDYVTALYHISAEARTLGRSPRWQNACDWFEMELAEFARPLDWIATQGLIWLAYAQ